MNCGWWTGPYCSRVEYSWNRLYRKQQRDSNESRVTTRVTIFITGNNSSFWNVSSSFSFWKNPTVTQNDSGTWVTKNCREWMPRDSFTTQENNVSLDLRTYLKMRVILKFQTFQMTPTFWKLNLISIFDVLPAVLHHIFLLCARQPVHLCYCVISLNDVFDYSYFAL